MKVYRITHSINFILIILLSSCDTNDSYFDNRLKVVNNSQNSIYADFYQSYPDTSLSLLFHFSSDQHKINPGGRISLGRGGDWETAFKDDINQKLIILIFDGNTIETVPWDTIRKKYLVLKRYDLTLDSLKKLNWVVTYPN